MLPQIIENCKTTIT